MSKQSDFEKRYVRIGEIVGTHGLEGTVRVKSYAESPDSFSSHDELFVQPLKGVPRPLRVQHMWTRRKGILLAFEGVNTEKDAERFVGASVFLEKAALEELEDGEYYWFELIGLNVCDENGTALGVVKHLLRSGSHDILVVEDSRDERLIPAAEEFVTHVDMEKGVIVVRPQE